MNGRRCAAWIALAATLGLGQSALAQDAQTLEPGSIEYKIAVQRATQAAIWAMPAVSVIDIALATQRDLGGDIGDIVYFSKPMVSRHGFLTANNNVPYVIASLSTKDGPIVVDVPPAAEKTSFFGTFVDAWFVPIADVGPPGSDQGEGGKYLFLPPGYDGDVPDGYLVFRPATYSVNFAIRPVSRNGGTLAEAVEYALRLQTYPLSKAGDPPPTHFIDAYPVKYNTLPTYDMTFFQDIDSFVQSEPVLEHDKAMMGLLAGIGIEKGKPFEPGPVMTQALEEGLALAYAYMQANFTTPDIGLKSLWKDRQWATFNIIPEQAKAGFPMTTGDRVLIDERAGAIFFWVTYMPKVLGDKTFYLMSLRDSEGNLMDRKSTYRLRVSKDVPARDFWGAIVYSMKSKGFIEDVDRVGLGSQDSASMAINEDGTVDLYFAPEPPDGLESNWIPTGEDFFLIFRLYGPEKALFDGSWRPNDIEKVD